MTHVTHSEIDVPFILRHVRSPDCGGLSLFLGTVRSGPDDGPVREIEYSGYEAMVELEFDRIAGEALDRWPEIRTASIHRLGIVPLGDASIAVAVAAPHRGEAFDACEFMVEQAKRRLPVWKKEILEDGRQRWRTNRISEGSTPPVARNVRRGVSAPASE